MNVKVKFVTVLRIIPENKTPVKREKAAGNSSIMP